MVDHGGSQRILTKEPQRRKSAMCPPPTSAVSSTLPFAKRYARRSFHTTPSTAQRDIQILSPPSIATYPNFCIVERIFRIPAAAPVIIAVLFWRFICGLLPPCRLP